MKNNASPRNYKNTEAVVTVFLPDGSKQRTLWSNTAVSFLSSSSSATEAGFGSKQGKKVWERTSPYQRLEHHCKLYSMNLGGKADSYQIQLLQKD